MWAVVFSAFNFFENTDSFENEFKTTSITISKAVHFLANHEEIQQRLRDEIDDVIGHEVCLIPLA